MYVCSYDQTSSSYSIMINEFIGSIRVQVDLKFGDGDGPNLCRVKKIDPHLLKNNFRSWLTLVRNTKTEQEKSKMKERDY